VLIPGPRAFLKRIIGKRLTGMLKAGTLNVTMYGGPPQP
jgi:hypothetical protein